MSSNLQLQETRTPSPVPDQSKKMSPKMIEMFVKELVVDRDFKVNGGGDIVMIRHLPVSKCTVPLLRQICVRFKVSGYKNQNKESTLGLLKNLVMRETLKKNIYNHEDDDSDSYFSVSSKEGTPAPPEPRRRSLSEESSAENKDTTDSTNGGDYNTRRDTDEPEEEYQVGGDDEIPLDDVEDDNHDSNDADDDNETKKKKMAAVSVTKRRRKKKSKGTAPDVVTCINTYFRVFNVYMCQRNRSLVMDLGCPPTKANLDSRTSPHRHVYEALLSQYLDENDDDAALFAYPDHVFWTLTGIRRVIAFSEFDFALASYDFEAIFECINHHYQIAYRRNKQSGSHCDFENFVGTRYF